MFRILLFFVFVVAVSCSALHPKCRRNDRKEILKRVSCTDEKLRNEVIQKSLCGEPKEVFVELKLPDSYLQVVPNFVWVKRCMGICTYDAPGSKCGATRSRMQPIPVRVYNAKTHKESCATYDVMVHDSCGCCTSSDGDCSSSGTNNNRKLSCHCPNIEERRNCLKKRHQKDQRLRWNRSKCVCENRRSIW